MQDLKIVPYFCKKNTDTLIPILKMQIFKLTESCRAGLQSDKDRLFCESCPIDTYKNTTDGRQCEACGSWMTTAGKLGAVQCECKICIL